MSDAELSVQVPVAVFVISQDRMADMSQMRPDLMGFPGIQLDLKPGIRPRAETGISGANRNSAPCGIIGYGDKGGLFVFSQPRIKHGGALGRTAFYIADIGFLIGSILKRIPD